MLCCQYSFTPTVSCDCKFSQNSWKDYSELLTKNKITRGINLKPYEKGGIIDDKSYKDE